jgi:hypothetical protein
MTKVRWQTWSAHGDSWHGSGKTRETARRLYLAQPFVPAADLARLLRITRARFYVCVDGLLDERKRRCQEVLGEIREAL